MPYQPVIHSEEIDRLYQAILKLDTLEDCYRFFEDLCTIQEVRAMAQRLHVAHMLQTGTTYHDIVVETGASTATISRINRCLHYGAGGYENVLRRLAEEKDGEKQADE